jgi:hypothetical protein
LQLLTATLPDSFNLFHFGDKHDDSVLSSNSGWEELEDLMLHKYDGCKNNVGIEGGDDVDFIPPDDKRFSEEKMREPLPLMQIRHAIERRRRIAKLLLCKLQGNHERKYWRFGDITKTVCEGLGVPYGTYTAKLSLLDKRGNLMFKVYETHGMKQISSTADDPIRREANMKLILKRHLKDKAGDCALMVKHHTHKLLVCEPKSKLYLTDENGKIRQRYTHWGQNEEYIHPDARWYGNAGSFLKMYGDGFSGYAEVAEYDPVELGFLITKVRDRQIVGMEPYYLKG